MEIRNCKKEKFTSTVNSFQFNPNSRYFGIHWWYSCRNFSFFESLSIGYERWDSHGREDVNVGLQPWRWRRYVLPTSLYLPTSPNRVTTQKTTIDPFVGWFSGRDWGALGLKPSGQQGVKTAHIQRFTRFHDSAGCLLHLLIIKIRYAILTQTRQFRSLWAQI
jgi:hypothetical protein